MANKSSFWAFGLVEVKGDLQVSEVYFEKNKPWAFTGVDWKQFREDRKMILKDIGSQTKMGCEFYFDGKKLAMKRRKMKKRR
jgi:hypothetical protein